VFFTRLLLSRRSLRHASRWPVFGLLDADARLFDPAPPYPPRCLICTVSEIVCTYFTFLLYSPPSSYDFCSFLKAFLVSHPSDLASAPTFKPSFTMLLPHPCESLPSEFHAKYFDFSRFLERFLESIPFIVDLSPVSQPLPRPHFMLLLFRSVWFLLCLQEKPFCFRFPSLFFPIPLLYLLSRAMAICHYPRFRELTCSLQTFLYISRLCLFLCLAYGSLGKTPLITRF